MERDKSGILADIGVDAEIRTYEPKGGTGEVHLMLHAFYKEERFTEQLERLYTALDAILTWGERRYKPVFVRFFLSDATNQAQYIREEKDCAVSIIQQPPLDGSKVAMWVYMVECGEGPDASVRNVAVDGDERATTVFEHNGYKHLWDMGMCVAEGDSAFQTARLFTKYEERLHVFGATLADNCQRTWLYVRDVDTNYAGLVRARRDNFTAQGLTADTHYIASTGIGGSPADTKAIVQMGCYALTGAEKGQVKYLYAPTHLNPTYEYGVTFERGTSITFGDRIHIYISGTASINNKGEVVHVGDVEKQAERMCENVGALLAEAEAEAKDVMQIVVYLRDINDYRVVKDIVTGSFPFVPAVYTLAPVCRPTWLVEMECIAVKECKTEYRRF